MPRNRTAIDDQGAVTGSYGGHDGCAAGHCSRKLDAVSSGLRIIPRVVANRRSAVFLGFLFATIFGHAPIIFPAVLGLPVPFRRGFYAHLVVLHASLVVRVCADLIHSWPLRRWGGLLNAVAVVLFLANTVRAVIVAKLAQPRRPSAAVSRIAV